MRSERPINLWILSMMMGVITLLAAACSNSSESNATSNNADTPCVEGKLDCPCAEGDECEGELLCIVGTCRQTVCQQGDEGCACFANLTCNTTSDGTRLLCDSGLCVPPACAQGTLGCGCFNGNVCESGLFCSTDSGTPRCELPGCVLGEAGCGCKADLSCDESASGQALVCQGAVCVEPTCRAGEIDCGCRPDLSCDGGLVCAQGTCQVARSAGTLGQPCFPDGNCLTSDLMCDGTDSTCQSNTCARGEADCGCRTDGTCAQSDDGRAVLCVQGTCSEENCAPGDVGCVCGAGDTCQANAMCSNGRCVPSGCSPGTANCYCLPGLECTEDGTTCDEGVCIEDTGYAGGACFSNDTCRRGNRCVNDQCAPCAIGDVGCSCYANGTCEGDYACVGDTCVVDDGSSTRVPPAQPECYTPCQQNLVEANGAFRVCSSEGLMAGCVGENATCTNGTCLQPGQTAPTCAIDAECPDYQTCIQGSCYSECAYDSECAASQRCYRHVCRTPCGTNQPACGPDTYCKTLDAENGYCMPLVEEGSESEVVTLGSFTLSEQSFEASNSRNSLRLQITNDAPVRRTFVVEKYQHDATFVSASGQSTPEFSDISTPDAPLFWATLSTSSVGGAQVDQVTLVINPGETAVVYLGSLTNAQRPRWNGMLRVSAEGLGEQFVNLSFVSEPDGQWTGNMYYYAQFEANPLDTWINKTSTLPSGNPSNAFLIEWAKFRQGIASLDQFQAMAVSTREGSWDWAETKTDCPNSNGRCYLWDGSASGLVTFTNSLDTTRIPRGVVDLPLVVNMKSGSGNTLSGKIVTEGTLHYAGDAALSVAFAQDPTACSRQTNVNIAGANPRIESHCLSDLTEFEATMVVGGRYFPALPAPDSAGVITTRPDCTDAPQAAGMTGFALAGVPWLVPGFTESTMIDPDENVRYRFECRDQAYPFDATDAPARLLNQNFAGSNPVPSAGTITRKLELVDGVMIDQRKMIILFKETLSSFLGSQDSQGFVAYGYIELERSPATLVAEDYVGNAAVMDTRTSPSDFMELSCAPDLLAEVFGNTTTQVNSSNASSTLRTLIDGGANPVASNLVDPSVESVHWLCVDTGLIDAGGDPENPIPCPEGSEIQYFSVSSANASAVVSAPCQSSGACLAALNAWSGTGQYGVRRDVPWTCSDSDRAVCNDNRFDPVSEREFYKSGASAPKFLALATEVDDAFRYKTRFRSRTGAQVGFTPEICIPNSDQRPYCYDPERIERIIERVDCALDIYTNYTIDGTTRTYAREFFKESIFAYKEFMPQGATLPQKLDGFEFLLGELLVMLGDDAYTLAAASRFDLANSQALNFEGTKFEANGIDLAGAAGYEMYVLYQATQHYQMVLDRFYTLAPRFYESLGNSTTNVLGVAALESYFLKVALASTRKAQAWRAIAERYQNFNRADLARRVIEREYTATYLESVVLSRFLLDVIENPSQDERAALEQIRNRHAELQIRYGRELREMRTTYDKLTDEINFFGFAPEYIPFPALDPADPNAFEKVLARARQLEAVARTKENDALSQSRSYNVDQQAFQAELARVRNNYETELAQVCGSFQGDDGAVYPAIAKYAPKSEFTALVGDPCGLVGNGAIFEAMTQVDSIQLRMLDAQKAIENHIANIDITRETVAAQCNVNKEIVEVQYASRMRTNELQESIGRARNTLNSLQRTFETVKTLASLKKCSIILGVASGGSCPSAAVEAALFAYAGAAISIKASDTDRQILDAQTEIADLEADTARWVGIQQACVLPQISAAADIKRQLLELERARLRILEEEVNLERALGTIRGLRNRGKRLQADQDETQQLLINVEAAKNDPNVRIYKNDAILTAERTFDSTVREAWRATRVYEYYTSQSYARRNDLFLARMISRGTPSVEAYLDELDEAFFEFEETYGNPDVRVAVVSLRDDVLNVPEFDDSKQPLTLQARVEQLRDRLSDSTYLDEFGYRAIPFSTGLDELSPLTRNHKIAYIEAEIVGTNVGDTVGRVYLRQLGTGAISSLEGEKLYYRFPDRTAVLNPFFNGQRSFAPDVYRSDRFKDRPYANTYWELVLNQKDEQANQDIDLQSLTDITLYIYYTDFTAY